MLVLSRKIGERVLIGDGIVVTILEIRGRQVRLGIEAPTEVPIWRGEISFFESNAATKEPGQPAQRREVEVTCQ